MKSSCVYFCVLSQFYSLLLTSGAVHLKNATAAKAWAQALNTGIQAIMRYETLLLPALYVFDFVSVKENILARVIVVMEESNAPSLPSSLSF